MRARSRRGIGLVAFLAMLSGQLGTSDRALAQTEECAELVNRAASYPGAEIERVNELYRLASTLQTSVGQDSRCRALALNLLCEARPEVAIPVLQRWRDRTDDVDREATALCLLALTRSQQEGAERAVREYLFSDPPRSNVLLTMLRLTEPASREPLAPLVRSVAPESPHRALAFTYLCAPPNLARFGTECDAEKALEDQRRRREAPHRYQAPSGGPNPDIVRAVAITTASVAIAGVHIGLSAHYRNSETNLGGLFAYQGALGGAMLIAGIGAAGVMRKNVTLTDLAVALILVPIGMLGAGIAGGYGGYRLGEPPGNGRVIVSVVSQAFILAPILGFSWIGVR